MARRMLPLVGACAALLFAVRAARRSLTAVEISGESMLPALQPGDFVLVRHQLPASLGGRIVYLRRADGRPLLKRVVGLPGESLGVGAHVEVNGRTLVEPYVRGETPPHQYRGANRLAPDEHFVLGDHRSASTDSRDFGPIPRATIEGVAWVRYWPPGRIGRLVAEPRRFEAPPPSPHPATDSLADAGGTTIPLRHDRQFGTTS